MIIGIGSDLIDIRRIEKTLERFGDRFTNRCYTEVERQKSEKRLLRAESYAKRYAAKEACSKALGTGFRKGVFFIARDLGIPVVPVAVTGMYDVMRKGSLHLRPGYTVTVHVCEPIPTAGLTDEEIPALADQCRRAIAEKVDAYWAAKARKES